MSQDPIILALPEDDAQRVVLVRAVEESDRAGRMLPLAARRQATRAALESAGDDDAAWLDARARSLSGELAETLPFLPRLLRATRVGRGLIAPVTLLALIAGLLTNAVGPAREIHVLALPLVGILVWNVTVLLLYLGRAVLPLARRPPRLLGALEALTTRLVKRLPAARLPAAERLSAARSSRARELTGAVDGPSAENAERSSEDDEEKRRALARQALGRYLGDYFPVVAPLASARLRAALHAGSLALVAGTLGGMYLRGILFRYEAVWESTFLRPRAGQTLLDALLTPASRLTGIPVPSVEAIAAAPGDAAPWLHLWAATAALFVAVPRLALFTVDALRVWRRRRRLHLTVPAKYPRRLRLSVDDTRRRIEVLTYSYQPAPRALQNLKTMLYDVFGPRAEIRVRDLAYGDEIGDHPEAAGGDPAPRARLLLASIAQTPESEVHGALVESLRRGLDDGQALAVVLDAAAYRRRLGVDAGERVTARRKTWDRVLAEAGVPAIHADLEAPQPEDAVARLIAGVWPPGALDDLGEGG